LGDVSEVENMVRKTIARGARAGGVSSIGWKMVYALFRAAALKIQRSLDTSLFSLLDNLL
jgi:hypothetical protein